MTKEITENKMSQALDFAYNKAVSGILGLDSAIELAENHRNNDCLHNRCNTLIR